jgi:hypothetical protein
MAGLQRFRAEPNPIERLSSCRALLTELHKQKESPTGKTALVLSEIRAVIFKLAVRLVRGSEIRG